MAARLGFGPNELGGYNGLPPETILRTGEIVALPKRVPGGLATPGMPAPSGTAGRQCRGHRARAGRARQRQQQHRPAARRGRRPGTAVRHQVARGETAYTIARQYGVSVRALAEWNGLDSALTVREGQYLLIPVVIEEQTLAAAAPAVEVEAPGAGSAIGEPPSAATGPGRAGGGP
ncbi:MAG: LysM domain-containing protein [Paracoccaceae bacterium]